MREKLVAASAKLGMSLLFSSLIAVWHALFFNVRVNSRMVLQPWLLQQGFIPYVHIGDEHSPLLPYILSWLSPLFNDDALFTARIVHVGLIWLIVAVCIWTVFDKAGRWAALACSAYFFAMSNSLGFWAMWYDLAVAPIFLVAYFVVTNKRISFSNQMLLIGLLSGFGFLIKQQALLLSLIVPIALVTQPTRNRSIWSNYVKPLIMSVIGFLTPVSIYLFYYFELTNDWYALWYWLVLFNVVGDYGSLGAKAPSVQEIRSILPAFVMIVPFILETIGVTRTKQGNQVGTERWWLLLMMALSAIMLYPRYSTMHWATMLPFLAIASGIACGELLSTTTENRVQAYQRWGVYIAIVGMLWIGSGLLIYRATYQNREMRILIEYDSLPELANLITDTTQLGNIMLFPDDEGVGNLYYLLKKLPIHFWMMNYPWFLNGYEINRWRTVTDMAQPDQVIYFASRGPHLYPEMDAYISERYETTRVLEWNSQIVEIKERTTAP